MRFCEGLFCRFGHSGRTKNAADFCGFQRFHWIQISRISAENQNSESDLQPGDKSIQNLTNGNDPSAFVSPYREQGSISSENEVSFSGKSRAYDNIIIGIRRKARYRGRPDQGNQFGI